MNLTMIGAGYVGLVTGACLANFGHTVTCVDKDPDKIAKLAAGEMPIFEPGLDALVTENVQAERLAFTTDLAGAVAGAEAVFIAVGTPTRGEDGHADLTFVRSAAADIAGALDGYTVIINKSTVPVGTGDEVESIVRRLRPDAEFAVVSNPEFLREGAAIEDFKIPNRIVVGTTDPRAREVMAEVYRPLFLNQSPILYTDRRTAELIKYGANAFLAAKITFINEMADLCEKVGGDVQDVARGIGLDNRIGPKFLHPGPGFGGSCFPKDTLALVKIAEAAGTRLRLVEAVVEANEGRKAGLVDRVAAALGGPLAGRTVAVLGLTFKPKTDDMREAPSLTLIPALAAEGAAIRAYDPEGMETAKPLLPRGVFYARDPYDCARGADALVILTEWEAFRALDLRRLKAALRRPLIVDLRNIYRPSEVRARGFEYYSVGRSVLDRGEVRP